MTVRPTSQKQTKISSSSRHTNSGMVEKHRIGQQRTMKKQGADNARLDNDGPNCRVTSANWTTAGQR